MESVESSSMDTCAQKQEEACCDHVRAAAKGRELTVLNAFADGLTPQQVANRLGISVKTVDTHKTRLYIDCRSAWGLPPNKWLDYHFLHTKFAELGSKNKGDLNINEHVYCTQVIAAAKKRELAVLNAFADGLTPQQVADRLGISIKTVDTYKTILFRLCYKAWKFPPDKKLNYHFLNTNFAHFSSYIKQKMPSLYRVKV